MILGKYEGYFLTFLKKNKTEKPFTLQEDEETEKTDNDKKAI